MSVSMVAGLRCSTASSRRQRFVWIDRARAGRYLRAGWRWARLLAPPRAASTGIRVFYGHDRIPEDGEPVAGGTAKFQRLARPVPDSSTHLNLLYPRPSSPPPH